MLSHRKQIFFAFFNKGNTKLKQKIKKKKRKKIRLIQVIKWFFIALACLILIAGIFARIYHFFTVHVK